MGKKTFPPVSWASCRRILSPASVSSPVPNSPPLLMLMEKMVDSARSAISSAWRRSVRLERSSPSETMMMALRPVSRISFSSHVMAMAS